MEDDGKSSPKLPIPGKRNILITSALPYVNNVPHLGNIIGCVLSADVYARYCRLRGYNAIYICGTDEYGTATETKALEENCTPKEICDKYHAIHKEVYDWFGISFDKFGRTSTPEQTEVCQAIFNKLWDNKWLSENTMQQLYCDTCKKFLADRLVEGSCPFEGCNYDSARGDQCEKCGKLLNPTELKDPKCKVCQNTPRIRDTDHLFIELPLLKDRLEAYIKKTSVTGSWSQNAIQTTNAWLRDGLRQRCITRDLKWGVPVPHEKYKDKVFYVWFDAPIGYVSITSCYTSEWEKWWKNPENVELYQFMGKDNVPFHTVMFPSTQLGTEENWTLMKTISVTEYLNYEDGKFSKSKGVGVFGNDVKDTNIPVEVWRYYLLTNRPEVSDTSFSWTDLQAKLNGELLSNLGNFVNRVLSFIAKPDNAGYGSVIPDAHDAESHSLTKSLAEKVEKFVAEYVEAMEKVKLKQGLKTAMLISSEGNYYLQASQFWFLCYSCLQKQGQGERINLLLEEPLLNGAESSAATSVQLDKAEDDEVVTPFSNAGFLSHVSFSWMSPLIVLGNEKIIDSEDVPQVDNSDRAEKLFWIFRSKLEWDDGERRITTYKLIKALFFSVWRDILLSTLFAFVYTVSCYVAPYLMDTFVQYLNGQRQYSNQGVVLVTTFFVAKLVECQARRNWYFRLQKAGIGMRSVLVSMIYEKGLTLPCYSKQGHTSGEIINLMTVDAERISAFSWYMHDPWILVLQISLALLILYRSLGLGSIAAFAATFLVMLGNIPLAKLEEKFQGNLMESKDNRMKKTSEALLNMRILKLQGWEMKFLHKILDLRGIEAGWLKKFVYNSAAISSVLWAAPSFVSATAFGACMLLKIPLESGKIIAALATFRILQTPIYKLPDTISMIVQTKVSLDRIATFLCLDDLQQDGMERLPSGSSKMDVEVSNGAFSWDDSSPIPTLKDIRFKIPHGMNIAICGTVGSGKSSLLSSILGEVPKISGNLKVCGRKAYIAQSPWIQSGKVEENILFGKPMQREWYQRVLEACSLNKDLEVFPFRDQTVIGERGINLSGGQKQRIQIARALYQDADIYLFDDPFSAVDAHTGSHLFKEVLLGLLRNKTVIYVTHQLEFLPEADLILVMKDGRITQAGKYNEILESGTDFMELVGAHTDALAAVDSYEKGSASAQSTTSKESKVSNDEEKQEEDLPSPKGQLVQEEEREKGKVGFTVYQKYMKLAYGGALVPIILVVQILFQVLNIGSNYWMAWVTPVSKDVKPLVSGSTLILVYVFLATASSFCILVRAMLSAMTGFKIATELFNQMHFRIFRASMSFFDATPIGRILNRASTDQSAVDLRLPSQFSNLAIAAVNILGIIGVMGQVAWQVLIVFIPVIAACTWYRQYYISAARELARLSGISRSPLVQHFSETLSGITTIRSFDQEPRFRTDIMRLNDCYSRLRFHAISAMEWLCFRLDLLSTVAFALSLVILVSVPEGVINPSFAGLAVTYALNLNSLQATLIWTLCDLENKMISVERMLQYIDIPSEPSLVIESTRPEKSWPCRGEITICNLQVRYGPHLPMVLRGLTCTFRGGLKTGIVGRTGCGKSTLIQTLFRIVEPAAGEIRIDGINILTIGLHDLRSRLSIIPQEPTMFEGTVRSNLDPLEEYADDQIWEALDKCQLGDEIRKKELKLDSPVSENGQNWSVGQRQLVCLGRVLLKRSKVLILDEATASVDTATDTLIQETLRQHFSGCTVITIAHRISSVIDSDMVLLLDQGLIEEHDSPARLLEDKSSSFSKLVAEYTASSDSRFKRSSMKTN